MTTVTATAKNAQHKPMACDAVLRVTRASWCLPSMGQRAQAQSYQPNSYQPTPSSIPSGIFGRTSEKSEFSTSPWYTGNIENSLSQTSPGGLGQ